MNDSFKLAMQLTMVDMLSGASQIARRNILGMGEAGKQVARDFDLMTNHISKGLKAIAVANYGFDKLKPGIAAASDLQEATLDVKMNLMESGQNAGDLARQLTVVRNTADKIQKQMPFGSKEVMGIENVLLKAGLSMKDVTAEGGAAWASAALATISKEAPQAMGEGLIAMASPFNVKGGQFGEMADFLQKVDQASVTNIPELVEGMKYVSGTAANMKVSWQDTLHAMGAMSQQGLKGSMAGTSLNDFLIRMVGTSRIERKTIAALNQELARTGKAPLEFFDKSGKLKALPAIINNIRTSLSGLTDKNRMFVLQKIFGEQGARAAFALIHEGAGSWEEVGQGIAKAAGMQAKLNTRLEGFAANMKSLGGTTATTLANLFNPMLQPLTIMSQKANEVVDAVGKLAAKHSTLTATGNAILGVGLGAAAGYGVYNLVKGGMAGKRVLSALGMRGIFGSLGGTAMGIAEGKAVQAATGVQAVFVTNAAEIARATGGGSTIEKTAGGIGLAAMSRKFWGYATNPVAKGASYLPMLASRAGLVGLSFGGGYALGSGINYGLNSMTSYMSGGKYGSVGEQLYDRFHPEAGAPKRDIKIDIAIDGNGRIVSRSNEMNSNITTMKRGSFFDGMMTGH